MRFSFLTPHIGELMGGLTLSNVRRGVTQACALGYWLGEPYIGQGHMRHAVALAVDYAFTELRLHRIEAACLPSNAASIARSALAMVFRKKVSPAAI